MVLLMSIHSRAMAARFAYICDSSLVDVESPAGNLFHRYVLGELCNGKMIGANWPRRLPLRPPPPANNFELAIASPSLPSDLARRSLSTVIGPVG
jgi:hypothetical protein